MNRISSVTLGVFGAGILAITPFAHAQKSSAGKSSATPARTTYSSKSHPYPAMGSIERLDPALDKLLAADAKIELLAGGFQWSEGPVWVKSGEYLLFSDVPRNIVFRWKEGERTSDFLLPSGYTLPQARGGEPGSNGLTLDHRGRLVLCQHGDRRVARLNPDNTFTPLARYYNHRRFNSPNDLTFKANGDLYFTDPPYGLEKLNDDPAKELMINGVYRLKPNGEITVLTRDLTFPNGIAFSPDEKTLYVAVSDSNNPVIMSYSVNADGTLSNGRVFFDTSKLASGRKGVPDGLKVDVKGNLFATGPGGVLMVSPEGKHLGTINTGEPTANCAWGNDGTVLYITANDKLCRVKTTTRGRLP